MSEGEFTEKYSESAQDVVDTLELKGKLNREIGAILYYHYGSDEGSSKQHKIKDLFEKAKKEFSCCHSGQSLRNWFIEWFGD